MRKTENKTSKNVKNAKNAKNAENVENKKGGCGCKSESKNAKDCS